MKQYFYFFIDSSGSLCCVNEYMHQIRKYEDTKAISTLDLVNTFNFKKIIIKDNKMSLLSNHNEVIVNDLDRFYKKKYFNVLNNVKKVINCSFRYRLVKDNNYDGISVNNMTFYTSNYKKKIALKNGQLILLSSLALLSSLTISKNIKENVEFENSTKIMANNLNMVSNIVSNYKEMSLAAEKEINEIIERKKKEEEERKRKDYKNFTSYTADTKDAYDKYYDIVYEEATRWGLDPNLVMAMLMQESHGQHTNLMQISYSSWTGHSFECYDFIDQEYKKVVLRDLNNPQNNIRAGCMILRHSIEVMDNNIMAGAQCYNLGDGNMAAVLRATSASENKTKEEILKNQDDLLFVPYVKYAHGGDKHYISNISRYLNQTDYLYFLDIDDNGNTVEYKYNLKEKEKVYKK